VVQECVRLEPELRSKGDAHVVVHTVVEEDVIADFSANTDGSGEGFDTATRIDSEIGRTAGETHRRGKARRRALVGHSEVLESDLTRQKYTECSRSSLKFRTEQSVQGAQAALHRCRCHTIAERAGVVTLEVVPHFSFQLNIRVNVECCAPTKTDVVAVRARIAKAKVFREDANLGMIRTNTFLRRGDHRRGEEECRYDDSQISFHVYFYSSQKFVPVRLTWTAKERADP